MERREYYENWCHDKKVIRNKPRAKINATRKAGWMNMGF